MTTRDEIFKTLQQLSKRTGFSIMEISYMARMMAQAEYDPLPPEKWGEPFEFPERKVSVTSEECDLDCIHAEIPKPNAKVDLRIALIEAMRDQRAIAAIFARHSNLSIAALFQIYNRLLEWERFSAVRDRNPEVRETSKRNVQEMEAKMNGFREKAKRRGVGEVH
jgi:hypothetical protein